MDQKNSSSSRFRDYASSHFHSVFAEGIEDSYRKRYYVWRQLFGFFKLDAKASILEIGCGLGHNLFSLQKIGYANVFGYDISEDCVHYCQKMGFSVLQASSPQQYIKTAPQKKFDLVILYDLLEHYLPEESEELLLQARNLLNEGGYLLISVPNAAYPLSNALFYSDITHKFMFTDLSLKQILTRSGYSKIRLLYMNSFTYFDDSVIRYLVKNTILRCLSGLAYYFWKYMALFQGVNLKNHKPTIFCICQKS